MGPVDPVSAGSGALDRASRGDAALVGLAFAAVYLIWGSTYLAIGWAVETIPPLAMIGARCLLAGGVLYGWARLRGGPRPSASDWGGAAVAGTLLFVTGQAVLAWAETRIASGVASLLIATEALFIALLGWRGRRLVGSKDRGSRPQGRTALALLGGFAGVAVMVWPAGGHRLDPWGVTAALLASSSWSVGVFRSRPRPGLSATHFAGMQLLAAGALLAVVSVASGEAAALSPGRPSTRSLLAFSYLVAFGSVVTYGAYVWLLDRIGPARLSTHAYVNPLVAVVLGASLGAEPVTPTLLAAMVMILGSVAVLVRPARPSGTSRGARRTVREAASDATPAGRLDDSTGAAAAHETNLVSVLGVEAQRG